MDGAVCVVTGATRGLGLALAGELARAGGQVVMVCRPGPGAESALRQVRATASGASAQLVLADLSQQASIREAVAQLVADHPRINLLVNNAAVYTGTRSSTVDGLETMFATNHLGPFLLTNLLLDALKAGAPSRVLTITAPSTSKLDFDDLQGEKSFSALGAFGRSKMANLLFTYELSRRLDGTGVSANAVHPGLMRTELMRQSPALLRGMLSLMSASPQKAAKSVSRLGLGPDATDLNGQFFKGTKLSRSAPYSLDPAVQARLWQLSAALVGLPEQ